MFFRKEAEASAERFTKKESIKYRPDIDGLRAIAVMSVIFAHADWQLFSGGFLGVDVFFVISGYLITTILRRDMKDGRYSLAGFYQRRARRILPALIVVIVCCFPFATYFMLPDFAQNFGQSVVATLSFSNNILLALTAGYWELESSFKPLLHTWSLGVEEQFYVLFPLFLMLIIQLGRRKQVLAIVAVGLISFAFSEYGWRTHPAASFYLPTSRAWELMVGCVGSYYERKPHAADDLLTLVSIALVIGPIIVFDPHTPSPSFYSAVPVIGTIGVILFNRPETVTWRVLSLRPIVFIGLISYSAYLWHQPLFAFARITNIAPPSGTEMALLTLATLVLATLSWRFIEQPFRRAKIVPARVFFPLAIGFTAVLAASGLMLHIYEGFPRWTFPNIASRGDVYISYNERIRKYAENTFPQNGQPNVLLVGNSYARDVGNVMLEAGSLNGRNLVYMDHYPGKACRGEGIRPNDRALYANATLVVLALQSEGVACARSYEKAVSDLSDATLVFVGSKRFGYNINPFGRVPMAKRADAFTTLPDAEIRYNDALVRALPSDRYLDIIRLLGPDGRRLHFFDADGNPLTPDRKHLTRYGAVYLAEKLNAEQPPAWRRIDTRLEE